MRSAPTDQPSFFSDFLTRPFVRYALAVGVVVAAFLTRYLLADLLGSRVAYITFSPAVMVAALLGGFWPGILATGLSGLLAAVWILPPVGQLKIENTADVISLAVFLCMGVFMSAVASLYRGARERAAAYDKAQAVHETAERFREVANIRPASSGSARPPPRPPEPLRVFKTRLAFDACLALTVVLLMTVGLLSYRNMTTAMEADRWETHTYVVVYELGDLLSALGDVTSSQRGYIITGDQSYLDQYAKALGRVDQHLNILRRQTADNSGQQQRFTLIERLLEERLALIKDILELRVTKGFEAASTALMTGRGQQIMGELRQLVEEARQEEMQLLKERGLDKEAGTNRTIQSVVLGASLGGIVLVAVFILLRVELARRQRIEQELRMHQDHLTDLVDLRTQELRREREALLRSETTLRGILNATEESIWQFSPDGRILLGNATAVQRFGRNSVAIIGRRFDEIMPAKLAEARLARIREVIESRQSVTFEDERNGIEFHHRFCPVLDDAGRVSSIACFSRDITESKRAEAALRESEARFKMIASSTPDHLLVQDRDLRYVLVVNPQLGLTEQEMLGKTDHDFLAKADADHLTRIKRQVLETGRPVHLETPLISPRGELQYFDGSYVPKFDATGRIDGLIGYFKNVTERKLREAEFQKLNRTLKALSNSNQAMLHATDESAYLQDVCRIIAEDCGHVMVWIGLAEDDAGRTVRPVAHAGFDEGYLEGLGVTWADTERGRGPTGTAIRTGITVQCADMLQDPAFAPWREEALKRGYASSLAIPLVTQNQPLGAITIYSRQTDPFTGEELKLLTELASDVSYGLTALRLRAAHARAEQAAREREEELVAIYENAPVIMLLVDQNRLIHKANKETEKFAGARTADLVGRAVGDALHCPHAWDDTRGCGFGPHCQSCALRQTINHTIDTGRSHHELEVAFATTSAGQRRENTFLLSTLRLTVREQLLALATMQNITRRKQAEEALRRAHAELELRVAERTAQLRALTAQLTQSEERERRRIAQILHDDLQQLLVAARLRIEAVRGRKDQTLLDEDLGRVQQLINESNDLARGLSHEISPAVLHEYGLVAGLQWLSGWMREKHGFAIRVAAPAPIEMLAQDVHVLLFQSVRELLFNAVKHSGVKRASVRLRPIAGGWLEIQVSDRGQGFDPTKDATTGAGAAGFGLFSIRERLAYLGGHMEVESAPGQGCRVRLRVPPPDPAGVQPAARMEDRPAGLPPAGLPPAGLPPAGLPPATAPGRSAAPEDPRRPPAKIRVLLADDHRTMRDGLAEFLARQLGIEVVGTASDGQEAVELTAQCQPQVVIMDVGMPHLDGIEATRRIRSAWPQVRVIGLTMHADDSNHAAMRAAGAVDCLVKSGPTEDLLQAVRTAVATTGSAA
jgi:PAS domain S-box-containing protein